MFFSYLLKCLGLGSRELFRCLIAPVCIAHRSDSGHSTSGSGTSTQPGARPDRGTAHRRHPSHRHPDHAHQPRPHFARHPRHRRHPGHGNQRHAAKWRDGLGAGIVARACAGETAVTRATYRGGRPQ